jgi:hypothetical protein
MGGLGVAKFAERKVRSCCEEKKKLQNFKEGWRLLFFLWLRNNLRGRQCEIVV